MQQEQIKWRQDDRNKAAECIRRRGGVIYLDFVIRVHWQGAEERPVLRATPEGKAYVYKESATLQGILDCVDDYWRERGCN